MELVKVQNVLGVIVGHFDDGEPRIKDLELAERLRYATPRNIRKLIARMIREGKLNNVAVVRTVPQTERGGRPEDAYYLTEAQALKVTARSETDTADQMLDLLIEVFLRVKGGHRLDAPPSQLGRDEVMAMVKEALEQVLPRMLAPAPANDGVVGRAEAKLIRAALMHVAVIDADGHRVMARSRRTKLDNELRSRLEFFGSCRSWDNLPCGKLGAVKILLQDAEKRARDESFRRNQARQGTLFEVKSAGERR